MTEYFENFLGFCTNYPFIESIQVKFKYSSLIYELFSTRQCNYLHDDFIDYCYWKMIFKQLAYTLTAYCYGSKSVTQPMLRQSTTYGTKYRVRQIVHKTTRTDINSRTLQAAVIVLLDFRNLKSTRNKNNKFLKYKICICLDHTYIYIVLPSSIYMQFHNHW